MLVSLPDYLFLYKLTNVSKFFGKSDVKHIDIINQSFLTHEVNSSSH